ncbi:MAG: RNA polymerase sigma factor [Firmicutes bacterium]|nr:RNA polymerase sigma factor [Bacillota bacterium]
MDKIYDEYYYKIYYWSIKKTNTKEDAEDLTNSIFVSIFEYFNKNVDITKLENLIWKIAHNVWSTRAKKYIKEKNNTSYDKTFDIGYEENNIDKIIYKEIVNNIDNIGLTEKEKTSFNLYYIQDFSIKYISEKLSTTESNVKYYLYNARKKIKERYYE